MEGNPTSITVQADDVDLALNRIDVWQMCNGESSAMNLDTQFKLNIAETDQGKLLELLMVVKYEFGAWYTIFSRLMFRLKEVRSASVTLLENEVFLWGQVKQDWEVVIYMSWPFVNDYLVHPIQ